jgi:hypothetical protein
MEIHFSSKGKRIAEQLVEQQICFDENRIQEIQIDSDAICRLMNREIISRPIARSARVKLLGQIIKEAVK